MATWSTVPLWVSVACITLSPPALGIIFKARPADLLPITGVGVIAYVAASGFSAWTGNQLGPFFAALLVGLLANAFARFGNRPASVVLMPAIMMLVPGSVGFKSITFMLEADVLGGVEQAFHMMLVTTANVAGLLTAGLLFPPRRYL
jgi:uncharacterized membrane protein YjjB (DUF3815 family)